MSFAGVYPILYAFFGADGVLDEAAMRHQVRACLGTGAQGIAVLGLATEVDILTPAEREQMVAWCAAEIAGRVPLAVTIKGGTVAAQIEEARAARGLGAEIAILQPSSDAQDGPGLVAAFGAVADALDYPVGIQNAPQYIGRGLTVADIVALHRAHPNIQVLKAEGSAAETVAILEATDGALALFNGRGGLEFPDVLRAGAVGLIPAPECCDVHQRIFQAMRAGNAADADAAYREILPLIVFVMQSLESCLLYGKRVAARRLGLEVFERADRAPTPFGLERAMAWSAHLRPF
ncbi:MAG: dihydrodipicolinate synthase family protein [Acuticoccus sp.]